jgi:hypothetical protein
MAAAPAGLPRPRRALILRGPERRQGHMSPRAIALLSAPLLLAGLAAAGWGTLRMRELDREVARLAEAGRQEGASYVETLDAEHAARQLHAFDLRRQVVAARGVARRDRLLGLLAAAAGGLGLVMARVLSRIAAEIEASRRESEADAHPGPPGGAAGGAP